MKKITTVYTRFGITEKVEHYDERHTVEISNYTSNLSVDVRRRNFMGNVVFHKVYDHLDEVRLYQDGRCILKKKKSKRITK